jgi:hypothetical protein
MKYKYTRLSLLTLMLISLFSCKEENIDNGNGLEPEQDKVRIRVTPMYEGEELDFTSTYTTQEGYRIQFTKINFIMTDFKNGNDQLFESAVYKLENSDILYEGEGDYSKFSSLTGTLGVSEEENHADPAARELDDPLNIMHTGDMHWGWNTGYIFTMIEGRIDTTGTEGAPMPVIWSYHTGKTFLLQNMDLENVSWTKVGDLMHESIWYLDADKIFNGVHDIDIKAKRSSHTNPGEEEISENIAINFKHAIRTK